ncbi:MAG TPA: SDR family NAD(P)-dependent oxidoreductase [Solirubrobacterales bacterium]|nr:SDR family NAD(P)-dependent oxidoreductase [Solirubrobacterales bacterium]
MDTEVDTEIKRALVIGAGSGIGAATATALAGAGFEVLGSRSDRDATDPGEVAALFEEADPDLVVLTAGTRPTMATIDEQSWESFSAAWNVDVKIAFEVGRAAIARPLRPGSTVVIVASGAALGGSPKSGGYAGAKRTQMFMADYLQQLATARELGIRFAAVAPQLVAGTVIAEVAASAYAAAGESTAEYMKRRFPAQLDAAGVADAILALAAGEHPEATNLKVTAAGLSPV